MTPARKLLNTLTLVSLVATSIFAIGQQSTSPPPEPAPAAAPAGQAPAAGPAERRGEGPRGGGRGM